MEIGAVLKTVRNAAGLSQEQAAEALGVSRQTVSNWETGKSYPDIVSVIRMSDLYAVSLDRLLKEESTVNQTYRDYLEESTNTVKSDERKSKLILLFSTLGIWALCVLVFFLLKDRTGPTAAALPFAWAILPALFFAASCVVGARGWFGKAKWLMPLLCAAAFALSGTVTAVAAEGALYRAVTWPDPAKLPAGALVSLAGLLLGAFAAKKKKGAQA